MAWHCTRTGTRGHRGAVTAVTRPPWPLTAASLICVLADSITWGCGNGVLPHVEPGGCERDAGSYRIPVAQALEQWNITVTTVGSLTAGPASSPLDWQHHEGHPGWTIEQVLAISPQWLATAPTVITMHLGTNDCGFYLGHNTTAEAVANSANSLATLLKAVATALPQAQVFVASILRMPTTVGAGLPCGDFVVGFNAAIPRLLAVAGANFHYVPLYENTTNVCGDAKTEYSIGDGVHPNAFGHLRVGAVFAQTIATTLCPTHRPDVSC